MQQGSFWRASVVPYGKTFAVVGGWGTRFYNDKIFVYDSSSGRWIELSSRLSVARSETVAMLVSPDTFPDC